MKKYSLYAVGEIALVVIGILIALQINNWNESRKDQTKLNAVLNEVKGNLEYDIKQADEIIKYYQIQDSVLSLFLDGWYSETDLRTKNWEVMYSPFNFPKFSITDNGYLSLKGMADIIPQVQTGLLERFKTQYGINKEYVEDAYENLRNSVINVIQRNKTTKDWWGDFVLMRQVTDEAFEYFTNNPIHRNDVAMFNLWGNSNYARMVGDYRASALRNYMCLSKMLGNLSDIPDHIPENNVILSQETLEEIEGTYRDGTQQYEVYVDYLLVLYRNSENEFSFIVTGENTFKLLNGDDLITAVYDQNNDLEALKWTRFNTDIVLKKIR
jgi:hypothetical protein